MDPWPFLGRWLLYDLFLDMFNFTHCRCPERYIERRASTRNSVGHTKEEVCCWRDKQRRICTDEKRNRINYFSLSHRIIVAALSPCLILLIKYVSFLDASLIGTTSGISCLVQSHPQCGCFSERLFYRPPPVFLFRFNYHNVENFLHARIFALPCC